MADSGPADRVSGYRRSYWKAIIAAALVAAGGLAFVVLLAATGWPGRRPWGPLGWLAWGAAGIVAGAAASWAALVMAGGLIALRRDALEARGLPYARQVPREAEPGPIRAALVGAARLARRILRSRVQGLGLRPGEVVEVRNLGDILATLDERGTLDGLPFMPEMAEFCGKRYRVFRRVDKINDWIRRTGLRRPRDTVLLERLHCDGSHHGGCQANCHLRWNEAWLSRPARGASPRREPAALDETGRERLAARRDESGDVRYVCQATELAAGTTPLAWADPRHYLRDWVWGNVRLGPLLTGISLAAFNRFQRARGGVRYPCYARLQQKGSPQEALDLRPGETVVVRSKREIERTLNAASRNRGLWFDGEMLRFCGGEYRVLKRVDRLIEESTGKLVRLATPCVVLDGITASGEYLAFCAQNEAIFWREVWLSRRGEV